MPESLASNPPFHLMSSYFCISSTRCVTLGSARWIASGQGGSLSPTEFLRRLYAGDPELMQVHPMYILPYTYLTTHHSIQLHHLMHVFPGQPLLWVAPPHTL